VALNRALSTLSGVPHPDPDKLSECRARIERDCRQNCDMWKTCSPTAKSDDALKLLERIDTHYGGLAAPRSIALAEQIEALPPKQAGRAGGDLRRRKLKADQRQTNRRRCYGGCAVRT